jgi:hypothetical protein
MTWTAFHTATRTNLDLNEDKEAQYDADKKESLPILEKEAKQGMKGFKPIKFQPVHSIGIFEAEFGVKNQDLIFHFWPDGYHQAERDKRVTPRFPKNIGSILLENMSKVFDPMRIEVYEDRDVGAWFVKANGFGDSTFHRELAIKAVTAVHKAMGGS